MVQNNIVHMFWSESCFKQVHAWFLEIAFVHNVSVCVYVCVCACVCAYMCV